MAWKQDYLTIWFVCENCPHVCVARMSPLSHLLSPKMAILEVIHDTLPRPSLTSPAHRALCTPILHPSLGRLLRFFERMLPR